MKYIRDVSGNVSSRIREGRISSLTELKKSTC